MRSWSQALEISVKNRTVEYVLINYYCNQLCVHKISQTITILKEYMDEC